MRSIREERALKTADDDPEALTARSETISVIVPCYNAASTVCETVESILAQDAGKALEVVVVNDGSSDATVEVLTKFGSRIRLVTTPNRGASAARNLGTALTTGAYVQYVDADDILAVGTLSARVAALEESGADVAYTDWQKLMQGDGGQFFLGEVMTNDSAPPQDEFEAAAATSEFWAPPAALLYRRAVVNRIGPWPSNLPIIQDARFLFEAISQRARFVRVQEVGAYYRVAEGSLSRRNHARFIEDCAKNASEIGARWRANGSLTIAQRKALTAMWSHVALASLVHGYDDFERARVQYNAVSTKRMDFELGNMSRGLLGSRASAWLSHLAIRTKGLRRRSISAK